MYKFWAFLGWGFRMVNFILLKIIVFITNQQVRLPCHAARVFTYAAEKISPTIYHFNPHH